MPLQTLIAIRQLYLELTRIAYMSNRTLKEVVDLQYRIAIILKNWRCKHYPSVKQLELARATLLVVSKVEVVSP